MNHRNLGDSYVVASPSRSVMLHRRVSTGTPHDAALDMAFLSSVCPGHQKSGLVEESGRSGEVA